MNISSTHDNTTMPGDCKTEEYNKMKAAFDKGLAGVSLKGLAGVSLSGGGNDAADKVISIFYKAGNQVKQLKEETIEKGGVFGILKTLADQVSITAIGCSQTVLKLLVGEQVPYFAQTTWNAVITGFITKETASIAMENITHIMKITGWTANKVAFIAALGALGITVEQMILIAKKVTDATSIQAAIKAANLSDELQKKINDNTDAIVKAINASPVESTAESTITVAPVSDEIKEVVEELVKVAAEEVCRKRPRVEIDESCKRMKPGDENEAEEGNGAEEEEEPEEGGAAGGKRKSQKKQQQKKQKQQKSQKKPKRKLSKSKRAKKAKKQSRKANKKH